VRRPPLDAAVAVTTAVDDVHSRSRLAGYDPETLFGARFLVVGAGALGQNVGLGLALAGIGEITVVDFDRFEPHNATRSPLYPTPEDARRLGTEKSRVVAHRLQDHATAPRSRLRYAVAPVQALGDLPILSADVVICAVDTPEGRAHLAERCRLIGRPLVEAGFHGHELNLALYSPHPEDACYRCSHPARVGAFSCTRYALAAEDAGAIPAIQNGAAALAAMQAEAAICWLHGHRELENQRVYLDLRTFRVQRATLTRDPRCPGIHRSRPGPPHALATSSRAPLGELRRELLQELVDPVIRPAALVVKRNTCTACRRLCEVMAPEWRWLMDPRCAGCGGPFSPAAPGAVPGAANLLDDGEDELADRPLAGLGFPPGAVVEVESGAEFDLYQLPGSLAELLTTV
jgi:molybdopterin/thiamine biosynthesis adenylyltransferase